MNGDRSFERLLARRNVFVSVALRLDSLRSRVRRKKPGKHGTQEENSGNYGTYLQGACVPGGTEGVAKSEIGGRRSGVGGQECVGAGVCSRPGGAVLNQCGIDIVGETADNCWIIIWVAGNCFGTDGRSNDDWSGS
jgi:hypothetical protein